MGFFAKIKQGLQKTKASVVGQIDSMLGAFTRIDDDLFEELEEILVLSDVGVHAARKICQRVKEEAKQRRMTDPLAIKGLLRDTVSELLDGDCTLHLQHRPSVLLILGVNGVGKTTTIGKLATRLTQEGRQVLVAAADTFRAAAIEQLEVWAERAEVPLIKHREGADPAAVIYDSLQAAKARGADVLICDTAGRLHNKKNLMEELAKIRRVIAREVPADAVESLLVLDATTGQNGLNQAKEFLQAAGLTGIILTKLDGTAKGGIVIAIKEELGLPVKYIGVGEQVDDLQPFSPQAFAQALFEE